MHKTQSKLARIKRFHQFLKFKRDFKDTNLWKVILHEIVLTCLGRNLSRSQFLLVSGIFVGTTAGFVAVILKTLVLIQFGL